MFLSFCRGLGARTKEPRGWDKNLQEYTGSDRNKRQLHMLQLILYGSFEYWELHMHLVCPLGRDYTFIDDCTLISLQGILEYAPAFAFWTTLLPCNSASIIFVHPDADLGWVNIASLPKETMMSSLEPTAVAKKTLQNSGFKKFPNKVPSTIEVWWWQTWSQVTENWSKKTPPINRDESIGKTVFFLVNGSFTFQIRKEEGNL